MQSAEDYMKIASRIFAGIKYDASDEDVKKLADNMILLEKRGLDKLNKRLINSTRNTWNTIAEHNFAVMLASQLCVTIPICYEPDDLQKPPDFKVSIGDITYWIQMKDLSKLERENRQEKIIRKIKEAAKQIKVGKFFGCNLSDNFGDDCLKDFVDFLKDKAAFAPENLSFCFTGKNNQAAEVEFWSSNNTMMSELTLGYAGDLDMLNVTGLATDQIKESLYKASIAFNWNCDHKYINLVVMEADKKHDIDICNAFFGTEYFMFTGNKNFWDRGNDGVFNNADFSQKVAGVIALKRKPEWDEKIAGLSPEEVVSQLSPQEKSISFNLTPEEIKNALEWKSPGPIADYSRILYTNSNFEHLLEDIKALLCLDRVVYYNTRPPMGKGNFD